MNARPKYPGQLLCPNDGSPLTYYQFSQILTRDRNEIITPQNQYSTGLEKQQAVTVALAHSVLPNYAFLGGGVSSYSRIKVTKNDELVSVGDGVDDIVEVPIELV